MINQIITGDARELSKAIPDESVDLIFTDPVYEQIDDYRWLGETAMRVLKPNSACLAWVSTRCAARAQLAMEESGLTFQWVLYYAEYGRNTMLHLYGLLPKVTPCLYFTKGRRKATPYIPDLITNADKPDIAKGGEGYFIWQKNQKILRRYLESFSNMGDLVFDPFTGSGTVPAVAKQTGRDYIAFEIDEQRAAAARERVVTTPMPLFVLEPEQSKFDLESA